MKIEEYFKRDKAIWGNYGKVAIGATRHIQEAGGEPEDAWYKIAKEIFKEKTDSIEKGCPRNAYLGLCEDGLIVGVPKGNCIKGRKGKKLNKSRAVHAVRMLYNNSSLENDTPRKLWSKLMKDRKEDPYKHHDGQMDVVLALWHEGMIVRD